MAQTYYELLGVAENATDAEINAAFRSKAIEVHPDKVAPGSPYLRKIAAEAFKDLSEARSVLLDHAERRRYDAGLAYMRGATASTASPAPHPPPAGSPSPGPSPHPPPTSRSAPQPSQKHSFWKPVNTRFGFVALAAGAIGCLLVLGGIVGTTKTVSWGLSLILISLALFSWRHGSRPGTDPKILGGSVFIFIFALILLDISLDPSPDRPQSPAAGRLGMDTKSQIEPKVAVENPKISSKDPVLEKIRSYGQPQPDRPPHHTIGADNGNASRSREDVSNLEKKPIAPDSHNGFPERVTPELRADQIVPVIPRDSDIVPRRTEIAGDFAVGSTKDEVLAVQGTPTEFSESFWKYGSSTVYFKDRKVIGWSIWPGSPLKANMLPSGPTQNNLLYFAVGSTKDEILAVQGTPTEFSESFWKYGSSTVYFKDGRVTSWSIWPGSPLKANMLPSGPTQNKLGYFVVGSTRDEVLAVQGTPTEFSEAFLKYGSSTVYFRGGKVIGWSIWPGSPLKAKMLPFGPAQNNLGYFVVGSTKDEVLAVQGTPTEFSESFWKYGSSTVYFKDGRVTSWSIWPGSPLNVRMSKR